MYVHHIGYNQLLVYPQNERKKKLFVSFYPSIFFKYESILKLCTYVYLFSQDSCGIYPPCSDEGTFQILEDCKK